MTYPFCALKCGLNVRRDIVGQTGLRIGNILVPALVSCLARL